MGFGDLEVDKIELFGERIFEGRETFRHLRLGTAIPVAAEVQDDGMFVCRNILFRTVVLQRIFQHQVRRKFAALEFFHSLPHPT